MDVTRRYFTSLLGTLAVGAVVTVAGANDVSTARRPGAARRPGDGAKKDGQGATAAKPHAEPKVPGTQQPSLRKRRRRS